MKKAGFEVYLIFIFPFLLFTSCSMHPQPKYDSLVCYEVFVQSFRDSNNDGIGDLQGLISKLDYIKDLGANMVWITPVHPSPSYHKYDVVNYYDVHPDFGTMEDMEQLIRELHKRDMKLMMDFVINHTSSLHPWFIASSAAEINEYSDYYVWKDYDAVQDEINKKQTTFDSDNITQWHPGEHRKEHYYGFFWKGMPDLNFDNPKVREAIYKIGKFWIDKGVDGFRMDAAKHIYPDDQVDKTKSFWKEFTTTMQSHKSDIMIVGEVWAEPEYLVDFFQGLPMLFNFELSKAIPDLINNGDVQAFKETYKRIQTAYTNVVSPQNDAILLSNHDMNRVRSSLHGDTRKAKLAASILLTLPGTPFLYYGEEIGMLGIKPDQEIREPFVWGDGNFEKNSWFTSKHSITDSVQAVAVQKVDPGSIFNHYKNLIHLRHNYPAIATGQLNFFAEENNNDILEYSIRGEKNVFIVLHNLSDREIQYEWKHGSNEFLSIPENKELNATSIMLEPYSSKIFVKLATP